MEDVVNTLVALAREEVVEEPVARKDMAPVAVDDAALVASKRRAPMRVVSTGSEKIPKRRRTGENSRIMQ